MPAPFTTPVAKSVPFDPADPDAIAAGLGSTDVQAAIIEAKNDAINNDRFQILCSTAGNAAAGKFLEFFSGNSSDTVPWLVPETMNMRQITLAASAASTGHIVIYKNNDFATALFTADYAGAQFQVIDVDPVIPFSKSDLIHVRVENAGVSKPGVYLFFQNVG